jgi:hypothetical protein
MTEGNNPPCETCAERGRERPGVHPVGSGFLCDPCWRGEGSRAERALGDLPPLCPENAPPLPGEKPREVCGLPAPLSGEEVG